MVDREVRHKYADLIEAFLRGEMSNREYDDTASGLRTESEDDAIKETYRFLWGGYCDIARQHADDLRTEAQAAFRRCAVFLRSDRDLAWPADALHGRRAESWAVLGLYGFLLVAGVCVLFWALASPSWPPVVVGGALVSVAGFELQWRRHCQRQADEWLAEIGEIDAFPFLSLAEYGEEVERQAAERDSG